jgi:hypothetical protein
LLRIDPKPHDARSAPVEREHAPTPDPTSGNPPTSSGISIGQGDTTPRLSNISNIQAKIEAAIAASTPTPPEDNSGLLCSTKTRKVADIEVCGLLYGSISQKMPI